MKAKFTLRHDTGVLCAPTAFGKTVTAAGLIARRRTNTLIIVHRIELLNQWIERLATFLNIKHEEIGRLGSGKDRLHDKIDIAVMQSLSRKDNLDEILNEYGQIIADECHHLSAFSFESILKRSKAKYVLGFRTPILSEQDIETYFERIQAASLESNRTNEKDHISHVKEIVDGKDRKTPPPILVPPVLPPPVQEEPRNAEPVLCPRCGSEMIHRISKKMPNRSGAVLGFRSVGGWFPLTMNNKTASRKESVTSKNPMTLSIQDQITLGEDSTRQFKADVTNGESLAAEMAAFANSNGGTIYIGVADDGSTPGLSPEDVRRINQMIGNAASQQVRSPLTVTTENVALDNGRIVIVLTVPKGIDKPYPKAFSRNCWSTLSFIVIIWSAPRFVCSFTIIALKLSVRATCLTT